MSTFVKEGKKKRSKMVGKKGLHLENLEQLWQATVSE